MGRISIVSQQRNNVLIISVTSGIGKELATRYCRDGSIVQGTYRTKPTESIDCCYLLHCDIDDDTSVSEFINEYKNLNLTWGTIIICPCNPLPIKPFFECDMKEWSKSVETNAINQLRILRELYPFREDKSNVVFFAGGGVNNAVVNFSAYTISKIMLIKMCEFLDAENPDMNFFIIGPGWTRTKVHDVILANSTGDIHNKTLKFITEKDTGTGMDDIYSCIKWLCDNGKVASGRNFSVVSDRWGKEELLARLSNDNNLYKIRRCGNEATGSL